ncbi:MAG: hypothetical protein WD572_10610 [Gammaproteobacteria bacterium]
MCLVSMAIAAAGGASAGVLGMLAVKKPDMKYDGKMHQQPERRKDKNEQS